MRAYRYRIRFWSDDQIKRAWNNRGGANIRMP